MLRRARAVTPVTPLEWPSFQLLTMISRRTVVGPVRPMNLGSVTYIQSHIFAMARFSSVLSLGMAVGGDEETEVSLFHSIGHGHNVRKTPRSRRTLTPALVR